jgi:hypothetical protein
MNDLVLGFILGAIVFGVFMHDKYAKGDPDDCDGCKGECGKCQHCCEYDDD